ncbi:MAG: GTPase HflX [Nitrososphaeria archaeon]|nr:GTPase HflX [Nitrososphaeria archaeon]NIN53407.1 GTPase HflX [Nitrososphaeria archaeon]NIQ33919.1 GTPase HflX [Nitrososphaeria archaeon]
MEEAGYEVKHISHIRNVTSKILSQYKLEQLRDLIEDLDVNNALFDLSLKPKQAYYIAKELKVTPLDRIEIILKIFLRHAPTQEAKLQVKLASLRYELTQAKEKVRLAKLEEQPGFYGLGGYEVDVYYQEIQRRISKIREKLSRIQSRRRLHRTRRRKKGYQTISITGYTCSGKTTLFNTLTGLYQKVGEEPFTTLSTKFSILRLGPWRTYLVDTIGFISDLPPFMIHAFRSTLEEVSSSDLVLMVIDVAEAPKAVTEKFRAGYNLLIELGVIDKPIVVVANKIDLAEDNNLEEIKKYLEALSPHRTYISALKDENLDDLIHLIKRLLGETVRVEFNLPFTMGSSFYTFLEDLKDMGSVEAINYSAGGATIQITLPRLLYSRLAQQINHLEGNSKILGNGS